MIAGVSIDEPKTSELKRIGVKDSKLLSPAKRKKLYGQIKEIANGISVWKISPQKIDNVVLNGKRLFKLNYLEARYMAMALSRLRYDVAYVDCCDTDQSRFGRLVFELLRQILKKNGSGPLFCRTNAKLITRIKSEHHADRNYPVVSAASIVAKVTRDDFISNLKKSNRDLGSGYPSDSETIEYLRGFLNRSEELPPFTRVSWETIRRLEEEAEIKSLQDFFDTSSNVT